jgi:hypothetical protein
MVSLPDTDTDDPASPIHVNLEPGRGWPPVNGVRPLDTSIRFITIEDAYDLCISLTPEEALHVLARLQAMEPVLRRWADRDISGPSEKSLGSE